MDKAVRRTPWAPTNSIKLGASDVEKSLVCVSDAIRETDAHLFAHLIGGYEFLYEYHTWLEGQTNAFNKPTADERPRCFRKHIGSKFGTVAPQKYYKALVRYYEDCR